MKVYARVNERYEVVLFFTKDMDVIVSSDVLVYEGENAIEFIKNHLVFDSNRLFNYEIKDGKLSTRDKTKDLRNLDIKWKIRDLRVWFDTEYRYYAEKYQRFIRLGIDDESGKSGQTMLYDLDIQAEKTRAEINRLEALLNE